MTGADDIVWEEVAFLPDCAFAALEDARLVDDDEWQSHPLPFLRVRRSGYGMIYGRAECDGLPIEIGRTRVGEVVAAGLEFTNDVAELEASGQGRWTSVGRLRLGGGGAIALDKKQQHLDGWCHRVPLPAGWYVAEAFETEEDHIAVRLRTEVIDGRS